MKKFLSWVSSPLVLPLSTNWRFPLCLVVLSACFYSTPFYTTYFLREALAVSVFLNATSWIFHLIFVYEILAISLFLVLQ